MNDDDELARAIREHVKLILLRLKAEIERHPAPPGSRDTSVEVERKEDKSRRVDDL
jgi:hypothetical protein